MNSKEVNIGGETGDCKQQPAEDGWRKDQLENILRNTAFMAEALAYNEAA